MISDHSKHSEILNIEGIIAKETLLVTFLCSFLALGVFFK